MHRSRRITVTYLDCNTLPEAIMHAFVVNAERHNDEFVAPRPWVGMKKGCKSAYDNVGVFVAEIQKNVVGWAVCKADKPNNIVYLSAISTKAAKNIEYKGVGNALMNEILEVYQGFYFIYLMAINNSQGFYKRYGFKPFMEEGIMYRSLKREPNDIELNWLENMELHGLLMDRLEGELSPIYTAQISSLSMVKHNPVLFEEVMEAYKEENIKEVKRLLIENNK